MNVMRSFHIAANQDVRVVFSFSDNYLFVFSKDWKLLKVLKSTLDESYREMYLAYCVIENEIIMAPFLATNFVSINYITGEQRIIEGLVAEKEKDVKYKFRTCFVQGKCVWFIGEGIKKIICINADEAAFVVEEYPFGDFCWAYDYVMLGEKIYIPSMNSNNMLIINVEDRSVEIKELSVGNKEGYCGIYLKGEDIILVDRSGKQYIYKLDNISLTGVTSDYIILKSFNYKDKIFKMCRNCAGIYIEYANGEEEFLNLDTDNRFDGFELPIMAATVDGEDFIFQWGDGNFYTYCDSLGKPQRVQIKGIDEFDMGLLYKNACKNIYLKGAVNESPLNVLEDFLSIVCD